MRPSKAKPRRASAPRVDSYDYILGDSPTESERLRNQARLWDPVSLALFDRLALAPGMRILEVGPGQGSLHLELRRRVRGPVDAVERSPVFAPHVAELCKRDRLGPGRMWQCDLLDAPLPRAHYDVIFARWVFLFLPDPAAHLAKLVTALRPGGVIALQEYHRATLEMVPPLRDWAAFCVADRSFFASQGGDVSVGSRLPALYREAGLELVETNPTLRVGHPGSATWNWLSDYFLGVMDRMVEFPPFTAAAAKRLRTAWLHAARDPAALAIGPTVLDVVGRKPKSRRNANAKRGKTVQLDPMQR
ncbi:MAG: class I SAM-dependent methyltransferase [Kofleriaceae bacterium]|nr:class I SAM-dependent methyltransferase [Kofleriaceae bacterium]